VQAALARTEVPHESGTLNCLWSSVVFKGGGVAIVRLNLRYHAAEAGGIGVKPLTTIGH
jgi:hypothetical protein